MPEIVCDAAARVVEHDGLTIDELVGNVASTSDRISVAHVKVANETSEPWLTLDYDEWMCVTRGRMVLHHAGGQLEVCAGQTVFIRRGERFRPFFDANTEYLPVCLPAFRPDRCVREEVVESGVSKRLKTLHGGAPRAPDDTLYHMAQMALWEAAKSGNEAYYPPTFDVDGFTHATSVASRLITTANHFYQDSPGEWVCLCLSRSGLRRAGIVVCDEEAMPVGAKAVGADWGGWVCPHIRGGIPPSVAHSELRMLRNGKAFASIEGLA